MYQFFFQLLQIKQFCASECIIPVLKGSFFSWNEEWSEVPSFKSDPQWFKAPWYSLPASQYYTGNIQTNRQKAIYKKQRFWAIIKTRPVSVCNCGNVQTSDPALRKEMEMAHMGPSLYQFNKCNSRCSLTLKI